MYDKAVQVIQDYIDDNLFVIDTYPRYIFDERSRSRWAANEIIVRILDESTSLPEHITGREPKTPRDIVRNFIEDLEHYICIGDNREIQRIFAIARDTSNDILEILGKESQI